MADYEELLVNSVSEIARMIIILRYCNIFFKKKNSPIVK